MQIVVFEYDDKTGQKDKHGFSQLRTNDPRWLLTFAL